MRKAGKIVDAALDRGDPDSIHFSLIHPEDGRALRHHFDELMIDLVPKLTAEVLSNANIDQQKYFFGEELLELYLEQALYLQILPTARALFRRDYAARMGWHWNKPVGVIPELETLMRSRWPGVARQTVRGSLLLAGVDSVKRIRRNFFSRNKREYSYQIPDSLKQRATVAVELGEGIDPNGKNDTFWLSNGTVASEQVILVIERHNLPFLDLPATIKSAAARGIYLVSNDIGISKKYKIPLWRQSVSSDPQRVNERLEEHSRTSLTPRTHRWLSRVLIMGAQSVQYWENFFRLHNVAIYQHFSELSTDAALKRIAAARAGTVEFGRMRSQFFEKSAAAFFFQHQVAMVWNRNVEEVLIESRTRSEYLIEIGYTNDYLRHALAEKLAKSQRGFGASVTVTCVVYDNHSHHDNHFSRQNLLEFYSAVIGVAETNQHLGLIVKSKKQMILAALPEIKTRLSGLVAKNRCVVVTEKTESAAYNSLRAHIAVGIPSSTAVCEAAILGSIPLMYDPSGSSRFNDAIYSGVIYKDISGFASKLAKLVMSPALSDEHKEFRKKQVSADAEGADLRAARFISACLRSRSDGLIGRKLLAVALSNCDAFYKCLRKESIT
jgi:hypothetical protein